MPGTLARWRRTVIRDLTLLVPAVVAAAMFTFEYATHRPPAGHDTSWLEALLGLSVLVISALLAYSIVRFREQRTEVRKRVSAERALEQWAFYDPLTNLPNRRRFQDALVVETKRERTLAHATLLLDLNAFKTINDIYGHSMGDAVLAAVARRLAATVRPGDLVARLGGDEFAVLAYDVSAEDAVTLAEQLTAALAEPILEKQVRHHVGAAIGIARVPCADCSAEEVMRQADVALYRAKSSGRTFAIRSYDSQMDAALRTQTQMEDALRDAISRGAMTVAFQPIVELASARVERFEALGRWTDPALGDVPPATFVTVAESIQLARDLVLHQLNLACGVARHWPSHVRLAINLSPVQLNDSQLGQEIVLTLEAWSIETSRLEIEITETAVLQDTPASRVTIETLREAGARIVLDDFGTGYSSLHHVRRLRPHVIKIDRTFVAGLLVEPESRAIISAVAALGRGLGISITAEGIENRKQAEVLMGLGCECGQGFLYGWPMKGDATHRYFQPSREAHAAVAAGAARRADRSVG